MAPIRHLPLVQNWDCHASGSCCKEYRVAITDDEKKRIEEQGWTSDDVGGVPIIVRRGPFYHRYWQLNQRSDGSCVFLSEQGLCRIHERFGFDTKPLACRLFPFILVPVAGEWRVGVRFACPSAAANRGRALPQHESELRGFTKELAERFSLGDGPNREKHPPPALQLFQRLGWDDVLLIQRALMQILRNGSCRFEHRLRQCLALKDILLKVNFAKVSGKKLEELLYLMTGGLKDEVPKDPSSLPAPTWVGRVLFRQALALYVRKNLGPNRGRDWTTRASLLRCGYRFARGTGRIPHMHGWLPDKSFEEVESAATNLPVEADEILERYFAVKVYSMQFCGNAHAGFRFWEGFDALSLLFPILMWVTRMLQPIPPAEAATKALSIVDDHFGFDPILGSRLQRMNYRILASRGELERLIAWYGRDPAEPQ